MENIKTHGQLLQAIINNSDIYFSIFDMLADSKALNRKKINDMLVEAEYKQFIDYMDGYNFASRDEVYMAVGEYYEAVMDRAYSFGEMNDISEIADDYISEKGLIFEEEENEE